jgi:uncharacterized protein YbjT (DUF2867 family)
MPRILITGGTGVLGQQLVTRFATAGYTVRIMSRRAREPELPVTTEWAQADLESHDGVLEALAGVDIVVHAATSPHKHTQAVDVSGTEALLAHARAAGIRHFVYVSIVGIDRIPLAYYRHKLAVEALVQAADVPWSILRTTQFHTFVDALLGKAARLPLMLLPTDLRFQPIDPGDVADRLLESVMHGPGDRLPELGGPEVLALGHLASIWLRVRGLRRRVVHLPLPGGTAAAFRAGYNTMPGVPGGTQTWEAWVRRAYAPGRAKGKRELAPSGQGRKERRSV